MGIGAVTAARCAAPRQRLIVDSMPITGFSITHPSGNVVTDSAAGATALSTGTKTTNGRIATNPQDKRLTTILELAEKNGKSTGLISTKFITDATPAAFCTHAASRKQLTEIAEQMMQSGTDVILGGGKKYFIPTSEEGGAREDGKNLLSEAQKKGYDIFDTADGLKNSKSQKMIGLFALDSLTTQEPEPTLAEMTSAAISKLGNNGKGFFLMCEGGQIDSYAHGNNLDGVIKQTLLFNDAISIALKYAQSHKDTLVVVTADHETGGLGVQDPGSDGAKVGAGWVGNGHTGNMVPIYAFGPGAELFSGTHQNIEIPKTFAKLWKVEMK